MRALHRGGSPELRHHPLPRVGARLPHPVVSRPRPRDIPRSGRTVLRVLSHETVHAVRAATESFWAAHTTDPAFLAIATGKEVGHRIADYVDDVTCAHLAESFVCAQEHDPRGAVVGRSMGDTWIRDHGIFHPVNVKTGLVGSESRPNIVSLKKVATALAERRIDSYWLLFVKVDVRAASGPTAHVDLVNLFDFLDYVAYDAGTGQMMLKAKEFIAARTQDRPGRRVDARTALAWLSATNEAADRRLVEERRRKSAALQIKINAYITSPDAPVDQTALHLA